MGIEAAKAFLREIRDERGISQEQLASAIGLSLRQFSRWETENSKLKGEDLVRAIDFLKAPYEYVRGLILDDDADAKIGREAARRWLEGGGQEVLSDFAEKATDEQFQQAMVMLAALRANPRKLSLWIGYGQRLREESAERPGRRRKRRGPHPPDNGHK